MMRNLAVTVLFVMVVQGHAAFEFTVAQPAQVRYMNVPSVAARAPAIQNVAFSMGETKKFAEEAKKLSFFGQPSPLNNNGKKTSEAYPIAIPEVGERPTDLAGPNAGGQGNPSAAFKAQHDNVGRFARPLAALLIGFFVGSAGTLAIFRLSRGASTASEEPLLAVVD